MAVTEGTQPSTLPVVRQMATESGRWVHLDDLKAALANPEILEKAAAVMFVGTQTAKDRNEVVSSGLRFILDHAIGESA